MQNFNAAYGKMVNSIAMQKRAYCVQQYPLIIRISCTLFALGINQGIIYHILCRTQYISTKKQEMITNKVLAEIDKKFPQGK